MRCNEVGALRTTRATTRWRPWAHGLLWLSAGFSLFLAGCEAPAPRDATGRSVAQAPWAIRCATVRGPDRTSRAAARANALRRISGLNEDLIQLVHHAQESVVYYGRYHRDYDPRAGAAQYRPDPLPDLELIRSLSMVIDGQNVWPFMYATMEELPAARTQHPEWDLSQQAGYWSLHVAVFFNVGGADSGLPDRKFLAEEYCAELRQQGHEAYFHHGPVRSSVYVGLFPERAVQNVKNVDPLTGDVTYINRIVDPHLLELQREFPRSLRNGRRVNEIERDPSTGEIVERRPVGSFVVRLPQAEATTSPLEGGP